jgi:Cytochrome P460
MKQLFTWMLAGAMVAPVVAAFAAEPGADVQPPTGYRNWFHVNTMIIDKSSPLFAVLGGMHNVHVNSVGEAALKKGSPYRYPDRTIFLTDLHDFSVADGTTTEGKLKGLAVMVKDAKKYAATGGWGFQFFAEGDPKKPVVTDVVKQCFGCHEPQKAQDYVYSTYIP